MRTTARKGKAMRINCYLFGCSDDFGSCARCGAWLYDEFIDNGWLSGPWFWLCWLVRRLARPVVGHKGDVCGKRYWP